jgi:hypothetical protein
VPLVERRPAVHTVVDSLELKRSKLPMRTGLRRMLLAIEPDNAQTGE